MSKDLDYVYLLVWIIGCVLFFIGFLYVCGLFKIYFNRICMKCYIDGIFYYFYGVIVIDVNIFYVYVFERYLFFMVML